MVLSALGIDIGADSVKVVRIEQQLGQVRKIDPLQLAHKKDPESALRAIFARFGLNRLGRVGVTGRLRGLLAATKVPNSAALRRGARFLYPDERELCIVSIGARGFSVLELRGTGQDYFAQNSRCSQGTGNFLSQLVERFGLSVEEAGLLADGVEDPSALSGRCPVILKTDMTHLANKGEDRARILAGLYDALCENVLSLVRPRWSPERVILVGGVARSSRIRRKAAEWLSSRGLALLPAGPFDDYLEAIGAALYVLDEGQAEHGERDLDSLFKRSERSRLERVPSLSQSLGRVHRLARVVPIRRTKETTCVLGLDIGSTGSKMVAVCKDTGESFWESYLNTEGAPVQAAQRLLARFVEQQGAGTRVLAVGVTGSGREIVGSLMRTCYGTERIYVLNEIAAHARGAVALDPEVDTIFEIGGQDAKYIRLDAGRVVEAAMNEACSAGTGSFIAEQGGKFGDEGLHVLELARRAMKADHGISLGQHCSVFMAEVIDEAIAAGESHDAIIAGLYDSVIQNYLNRVKGPRTVGRRIFCQGMPFSSDALAAAVARQTERDVVVPPHPGTIGAYGIALLTREERTAELGSEATIDLHRFLEARVEGKETLVCRSTRGCGGSGNRCKIERLTTTVEGKTERFLWGGNCSLYDRGAARAKLPDRAPDPFVEREKLLDTLLEKAGSSGEGRVVAFPDEFGFKGLTPLFIVFLCELGFRCRVMRHAGRATLTRGIEGAGLPYCAPMQLIHGAYFDLVEENPDFLLLPIFKGLPRTAHEEHGTLCPMVIGSSDIIESLIRNPNSKIIRPVIDFDGQGYDGNLFRSGLVELAKSLGYAGDIALAQLRAVTAQREFEAACCKIGERALAFARANDVVPVAVLGRPYTIYNDLLNSNVPALLRSLGALAIPVDCLPLDGEIPTFERQYWSHTQRNLGAADYVRRTPGLYSVFCSNYACGPDSFTLHFYAYVMQNKPFSVIETDGHSGDAGTKTRLEAFLYCVDADRRSKVSEQAKRFDFATIERQTGSWHLARKRGDTVLLPRMGPAALVAAAALRGEGIRAEALPLSNREDVRTGRRHTSGKECLPMMLTLGTLLNRVLHDPDPSQRFSFFMPTANGPCRFGVYNSLHKIVLEREGLAERISIICPPDSDYFQGMSGDFSARLWMGFLAHDLLHAMRLWVRPVASDPDRVSELYDETMEALCGLMETARSGTAWRTVRELGGGMWGVRSLISRAARDFRNLITLKERRPVTVAVVGEIYVRLDPFANDDLVGKLEARGLRVHFAPFVEWLEYSNHLSEQRLLAGMPFSHDDPVVAGITGVVQRITAKVLYDICAKEMGWVERARIEEIVTTGERYVHPALAGEAVLTVGGPVHELERGQIDGVVIVGPHECMPCKISEARYARLAEQMMLPHISLAVGGEGVDEDAIDRFVFDLFERKRSVPDGPFSYIRQLAKEVAKQADAFADDDLVSAGE